MRHWPYHWGTGPYDGWLLYVALASTTTVSCTLNHDKGCSAFSFVLVLYVLFLFFQIMLATNSWKGFQQFSSINIYEALHVMFKSRANSSIKAYVRVIRKLLDWSKSRHFNMHMQLPFPLSVVSLYFFKVQQSGASSSSVILVHVALK